MKYTLVACLTLGCFTVAHAGKAGTKQAGTKPVVGDLRKVGATYFKTSCNAAAAKPFQRGYALLHSFFYTEAKKLFAEAAAADATCAIAHWGTAMTYWHPVWAPPDEASIKAGAEEIAIAKKLGTKDANEKAYIDALDAFYSGPATAPGSDQGKVGLPACHGDGKKAPDHGARAKAYMQAMEAAFEKNKTDVETASLFALALLGSAPMADPTLAQQKRAGAIIESFLGKYPDHPGLIHYYIHAYDYPALAQKALAAAKHYAEIAPWVPHVLHMPSHIFTRLGMWTESVASNLASAEAARAYAAANHPDATSFEELHALDYLMVAYLQTAQDKKALAIVEQVRAMKKTEPAMDLAVANAMGAIPARYVLERGAWKEAAALTVPEAPYWKPFGFAEAYLHFARGIGAARTGGLDVAKKSAARMVELSATLTGPRNERWKKSVDAQLSAVNGFIAQAEGKAADAEKLLRAGADLEDANGIHPVQPVVTLPIRELLGDLLLMQKKPADALKAYEASLAIRAARFYALAGAERAAKEAGDAASAKKHHDALVALAKTGDGTRPELKADAR